MKGSFKVTFSKESDTNWLFTVYNGSLNGNPSREGDWVPLCVFDVDCSTLSRNSQLKQRSSSPTSGVFYNRLLQR